MNNVEDGHIADRDLQYVDLDEETFAKFRLMPGDILFNRTNSLDLVGKTGLFRVEEPFVFASYLVRVTVDRAAVAPDYLNYYLNSPGTQHRLKMLASRGVSQSNINATKLKGFAVLLPPVAEQHRIGAQMATLEAKIRGEENRRAALDQLFRTLLNDLMTARTRVNNLEVGA